MRTYIVHYGELGLKGQNRPRFEKRLRRNIRAALKGYGEVEVLPRNRYLVVRVEDAVPKAQVEYHLSRIFGIAYFAPAIVVPQEVGALMEAGTRLGVETIAPGQTFRVRAQRGDKRFPLRSNEIERELGARIVAATGAKVRLKGADVTVHVQVYREGIYLFARRLPGAGGLPIGTGGRVLMMLSGGIDSPVAAHLMMKRGCTVHFLHFHMLRSAEEARRSKVVELVRRLMEPHRLPARLYLLPAAPFQAAMAALDGRRVETVAFRRFILRLGERLAAEEGYEALVTGDSLGQVASQTLTNLRLTTQAVRLPVLRPLIAYDKQEIVNLAQVIGTYDLSIQPYKDPCSVTAHRPATRAKAETVAALEAELDLPALMEETLAGMETVVIRETS